MAGKQLTLQEMKEKSKEGISVGYHPANTLDRALETAMDNFYAQLLENNFIIPKKAEELTKPATEKETSSSK